MAPAVSFSVVHGSGRLVRRAGNSPKTIPVATVSTNVKARIRRSGSASTRIGVPPVGTRARALRVRRHCDELHREAAYERQHEAFDQNLTHELTARCSERETHGDFLLTRECPRRSAGSRRWRTRSAAPVPPCTSAPAAPSRNRSGAGISSRRTFDAHLPFHELFAIVRGPVLGARKCHFMPRICRNRPCNGAWADSTVWPGFNRPNIWTQRNEVRPRASNPTRVASLVS